jgi:hypothetical protein
MLSVLRCKQRSTSTLTVSNSEPIKEVFPFLHLCICKNADTVRLLVLRDGSQIFIGTAEEKLSCRTKQYSIIASVEIRILFYMSGFGDVLFYDLE